MDSEKQSCLDAATFFESLDLLPEPKDLCLSGREFGLNGLTHTVFARLSEQCNDHPAWAVACKPEDRSARCYIYHLKNIRAWAIGPMLGSDTCYGTLHTKDPSPLFSMPSCVLVPRVSFACVCKAGDSLRSIRSDGDELVFSDVAVKAVRTLAARDRDIAVVFLASGPVANGTAQPVQVMEVTTSHYLLARREGASGWCETEAGNLTVGGHSVFVVASGRSEPEDGELDGRRRLRRGRLRLRRRGRLRLRRWLRRRRLRLRRRLRWLFSAARRRLFSAARRGCFQQPAAGLQRSLRGCFQQPAAAADGR